MFTLVVEDDHRDTPPEMFEILTHTEEICRHIVAEKEVLDVILDLLRASLCVILEPIDVAHFSIEDLTGRKSFIFLNHVKNVVRHLVVRSLRHILDAVGECDRNYLAILTEDFARVNGKGD